MRFRDLIVWPVIMALTSCAQPERTTDADTASSALPDDFYQQAIRRGETVYSIDTARSVALIRVGRAGTLKNLGHDHAIASEYLRGWVLVSEDAAAARADLIVPLRALIVDKPEYREQVGLDGAVSASSIEGTYANMQDKVLESSVYPQARISARFATLTPDATSLAISMTLHGTAFEYLVPVDLSVNEDSLVANGTFEITHADFGLAPYSAAGGLLRVAEKIEIRFRIVARRAS